VTWERRCVLCSARGRRTDLESGHVCQACLTRIGDELSEILTLAANASVEPISGRGQGRSVPSSKPPINVDGVDPALTMVTDCATVLDLVEAWERMIRECRGMAPYGPVSAQRAQMWGASTAVTLTGCVGFLRASLPWWADSPDQPLEDFAGEIHACRRALAKWDPDREPMGYVAFCPTDDCGARIRYHSPDEAVTCPRCHVTRDVPTLVAVVMATHDADIWADPETAALHYGISVSRLRVWAQNGRVERKRGRYRIERVSTTTSA
jgi:hypothetical protein